MMLIIGSTTLVTVITANSINNKTFPVHRGHQPNCASPMPIASKFFVLSDLLFFTSNGEYFETFRVMNLSSGESTTELSVSNLLQGISMQSLLWAFLYDPAGVNCRLKGIPEPVPFDPDRYCARVVNLRGLVMARLSNQTMLFLRSNNGKFTSMTDANNYIEMHALVKHLDQYGLTSSLTFVQKSNHFVSTHYGRHAQICITTVMHQKKYPVPLPMMAELLTDGLFVTECAPSQRSYTSVADLHGVLFAITHIGNVDLIQYQKGAFKIIQSMNEKEFLNCYGKSPAVMTGHYDSEVDLVLENGAQWESVHSVMALQISKVVKERSMVGSGEVPAKAKEKAAVASGGGGHFWNLVAVFTVMAVVGFVGYVVYKDDMPDVSNLIDQLSSLYRGKANVGRQAADANDDDDDSDSTPAPKVINRQDPKMLMSFHSSPPSASSRATSMTSVVENAENLMAGQAV